MNVNMAERPLDSLHVDSFLPPTHEYNNNLPKMPHKPKKSRINQRKAQKKAQNKVHNGQGQEQANTQPDQATSSTVSKPSKPGWEMINVEPETSATASGAQHESIQSQSGLEDDDFEMMYYSEAESFGDSNDEDWAQAKQQADEPAGPYKKPK